MVCLRLLGRISLTDDSGEELSSLLSQPKRVAVLSYLALRGNGDYLRRDVLMALFWAESDSPHARNALSQVLHAFRSEIGRGVVRTRGRHDVALDRRHLECDVWSFREALRRGDNQEALDLHVGPLMPGFHVDGDGEFERWLEEKRQVLREEAVGAAWALAHRHIREGALVAAERVAQRALALVWTDESPVRRFVAALSEAGDRAAAVRFYEKFRARLREDLDLEPSPATAEVVEAIRNGRGDGAETLARPAPAGPSLLPEASESADSAAVGGEVDPAEASKSPPRERTGKARWTRWWVTAAAAVAVIPVVFMISTPRSRAVPRTPSPNRPSTVLADVAGSASEGQRRAVAFLLRTGLDLSHMVQTVPAGDIRRTLALMERSQDHPLDPQVAHEVGTRLGVGSVVIARLDRLGDSYFLAVRMEEAPLGRLGIAARGQTASEAGVVAMVDSVVLQLRRQLGEDTEVLAAREPLPQVLTPSLDALQEFAAAEAAGPGQARAAMVHLKRAVALDTAFAMAWNLMASYYGNFLGQPDSAQIASDYTRRFPERLTEARRSDSDLHRRIREDVGLWDVALRDAEQAVLRNPRYLNNYGVYIAVPGGLPDSALNIRFRLERDVADKARRFNPDVRLVTRCFINTHYFAAALDRMGEWYALLDSMDVGLPPDCAREAALFESIGAGEWARVDSMVEHSSGDWRWPTMVETALLQMVPLRGGIRAAHTVPLLAHPETRALRPDSSALSNVSHLLLEVAYRLPIQEAPEETFSRRGEAKELAGRGRREVTDYVLYGVRESLLGDTLEAQRVAKRLRAMRDTATSRTFEGAFEPWFVLMDVGPAFQRGDWRRVVRTLGPMAARIHEPRVGHRGGDDYLVWWLLAEAHVRLGEPRWAIQHLESILDRPRFRKHNWVLQGFIHPAARFKLAGLYAEVGSEEGARQQYQIFLDTFTDPEPEFRWMVDEAAAYLSDEFPVT